MPVDSSIVLESPTPTPETPPALPATDEALYEQFLRGDADALEALIARYRKTLTLFLYGYVKDMPEAEQLMIDAFARLVLCAGQFGGKSSLKTYLFAIGRNEALRYLKKNPPTLSLAQAPREALAGEALRDYLQQKEERAQLYAAIAQLPLDYQQVLFLLYFEGMTYKEAAQVMRKNTKQIANLTHRAKKSLKKILEQGGFAYAEVEC